MVALILAAPVFAQKPIQDTIPQLKEWWVAPTTIKGLGRYGVSHIPKFYHGKDAMAVSINNGTMVTWLNRFPGDTTNIFSWKGGGPILQGDFNGDGVIDYFGGGYIYQGTTNGEPPDTATTLNRFAISPGFIADINHDGYDDVVSSPSGTNSELVGIVYGAPEFKNMKHKIIPGYGLLDSTMEIDHHYVGADGDMRFIVFSSTKTNDPQRKFNGYVLFRAHWNKGDTLPVLTKLSKVIRYKDTDIPFDHGGAVYTSKHRSNKFYIAKESVNALSYIYNFIIYDLNSDMFQEKSKFRLDSASPKNSLQGSIDNDDYEDLMMLIPGKYLFYSGKDIGNATVTPFATFPIVCNAANAYAIGDVTNDGIGDVVLAVGGNTTPTCLILLEGKKEAIGVSELPLDKENSFTLTGTSPHPLIRGKIAILSTNIPINGLYILELYNSVGKHVAELHRQNYEVGIQRINFDISSFPITSGSYILRIKNELGTIVGERTIIIE